MPSIQDTIYPRIKNNLSDQDLEEAYTPLHGVAPHRYQAKILKYSPKR